MNNDSSFSKLSTLPIEQLTWTTDTPTKPGWYWSQMRAGRPHVVELVPEQDSRRLTVAQTGAYIVDLEPENHRWAGPLMQPAMMPNGLTWSTDKPTTPGFYLVSRTEPASVRGGSRLRLRNEMAVHLANRRGRK